MKKTLITLGEKKLKDTNCFKKNKVLKITDLMWREIENGNKGYDVRKINKDFIKVGDIINFVDIKTEKLLGKKNVVLKSYTEPEFIFEITNHLPTAKFVKDNYQNEEKLIVFKLSRF